MSKKRKVNRGNPQKTEQHVPWTPFNRVMPQPNPDARALDPERWDREWALYQTGQIKVYQNSIYMVHVRNLDLDKQDDGVIHLSIRRNDRKAIRDWRHFYRIKNEIAGAKREAVEIYPSEDHLVDQANQYHLWVMPTGVELPFGFREGVQVGTSAEAEAIGALQREVENADAQGSENV